jgi:hypothetical protein
VAINNPEIVKYLLEHRGPKGLTVYDVMIESSFLCLPVFVELHTLFLKTNFGFWQGNFKNKRLVLPYNLWIERKVK